MALQERHLFGKIDKVQTAVERIRSYVEMMTARGVKTVGAFSGGKDSIVIKELARLAGVEVAWFYNQVGIDPPELVQYIKRHHPDVQRILSVPFFKQMRKEGWPPMRHQRWCCRFLKEYHGDGLVIIGIRWAESNRRANRLMFEPCKTNKSRWFLSPILDWSDSEVWEFIRSRKLPYCSLYDEGFKRLGCILCPMDRHPERHVERWPKMVNAYLCAFRDVIKKRKEQGKRCDFDTAEELFEWWITRERPAKVDDDQQCFRFDD